MAVTGVGIGLLSCFAVSSALSFAEGSVRVNFRRDEAPKAFRAEDFDAGNSIEDKVKSNMRVDRSTNSRRRTLDRKISFLAGEKTPVWIAYYADPNNKIQLTYKMLDKKIVKQAIDYYTTSRNKRSVNDNTSAFRAGRGRGVANRTQSSGPYVAKQSKRRGKTTVYYPSVLAVMEYGLIWPADEQDERKLALKMILYALAYWNDIDRQLSQISNPRIRIRVSGIVIGRDRDITNHVYEAYGGLFSSRDFLHYEGTLHRLVEYWGGRMRQKFDFQTGTYNIVALMTDARQTPERTVDAVSTDRLPCDADKPGATAVLITNDDLRFSGLREAVRVTARILGRRSDNGTGCRYMRSLDQSAWNSCDKNSIRRSLDKNGWCMRVPQEFHNPGNPVVTVLPRIKAEIKPRKVLEVPRF